MKYFKLKYILILSWISCAQPSFATYYSEKYWASAEYLYWWVQDSPINVPLITENNNPKAFAIINEPGTKIIFGSGSSKNSFNFSDINGGRITIGGWIDNASQYGIEVNAFALSKAKQSFTASSVNTSIPVINIPFNSGAENVLVNKETPNTASVNDTLNTNGFEINGLYVVSNNINFPLISFLGFRYLNIRENFLLNDVSFPAAGIVNVNDNFSTKNHFYGIQLGAKTHYDCAKFLLDISGAIALENNHQILKISGDTQFNNQVLQEFGIFSEPTNLGTHTNNIFSLIPELRVELRYQWSRHFTPFITYDGFYINHVIRPGNVIDRNINKSQNQLIGGSGVLDGPPLPVPQFKNTNMWIQGLSAGVNFNF